VSNHVLNAGLAITLSTPNIDDGSLAFNSADYVTNKNIWNAQGFNLLTPPTLASLLATSVTNTAPAFRNVINRWAAADRGATPDGFYNNAAVGRIVLNGSTNTLFTFQGTSVNNALYVDSLEFENGATNQNVAGDYTEVSIAPNMRIYYAQATAGGVSVAEKLDGRNNGRFRWVSNYNCGFFSSTNLVYPDGSTNRVNAALAQSCNIDSDGDGTVNCVDLSPIPPASLGTCAAPTGLAIPTTLPPPPVVISGSPGSTNRTGVPKLDFPGAGYGSGSGSFAPAKGSYSGLFYETNGVTVSSAGWFAATTTGRGAYTAIIMMGGRSYSLSGHFDTNGLASGKLMRGALHSLNVQLQVDPATDQIHGQITDGHWTAEALADRLVFNSLKHSAGAYAGSYTVFIPGNSPGTGNPEGAGFGTVKVDASGGVQFAASLADGTKVTQKSSLSSSGIWPLYVSLYGGRGCALSWMQFTNSALGGQLAWIKPAGAPGKNYGAGFTNEVLTTGLSYHKPAAGARVLDWSGGLGDLILSGGSLSDSVTNAIRLELNNKVTNLSPGKLTLNITTSSGLFKGSFLDTLTGKTIQFQGALFDDWNMGFGFFLDSSKSGQVFLGPAVP